MTHSIIRFGAALLPLVAYSSAIAQQPELGQPPRPGVLRLFERAIEQAPGLAVDPAENAVAQNKELRYPWAVAPPQTRAISFVRNMQDFSDKLDHVAERMNREPPGILRYSTCHRSRAIDSAAQPDPPRQI